MPAASRHDEAVDAIRALQRWGMARDWVGTDPYDGLNMTRVPPALLRNDMVRRVAMQTVKRSIVDLRPLLGIAPGVDAAALAWVATAYARGGFDDDATERARCRLAIDRMMALRSPAFEEPAWGYHWVFQSRVYRKPAGAPNTIATTYGGMALIDAYERLRDERLLEQAVQTGYFFLRHVPQTQTPAGAFFGYWPGDRTPIHNANLHVCGLLARLWMHTGIEDFCEPAARGVAYALAHQRDDGAWWYGDRPNLRWVDNFHTGYVLDSLMFCEQAGIDERIGAAVDRGLAFYRERMFLADGTPKYFEGKTYPVDSQCVAQAIQTLAIAAPRDPANARLAWTVTDFALRRMRRRDGAFVFQRRRYWTNHAAHMRGTVASMFMALAHLVCIDEKGARSAGALSAPA